MFNSGIVVIGSDLEGLLKMRRGFIVVDRSFAKPPPDGFYGEVRRGDCERVLKQSEAITPAMNLRVGKRSEH